VYPKKAAAHEKRDPEIFLSRFAVVAEGITEVGFVTALLGKAIGDDLQRRGVWISDAGGNDAALDLLDGLSKSGLRFAGFADDGGTHPGRWSALKQTMKERLFRWKAGCLEENIIRLLDDSRLEQLIEDPTGEETGTRLRTLASRLGTEDKSFASIAAAAPDLKQLIIQQQKQNREALPVPAGCRKITNPTVYSPETHERLCPPTEMIAFNYGNH
jgi:putative ATP-dependent endonuclease of OLD family